VNVIVLQRELAQGPGQIRGHHCHLVMGQVKSFQLPEETDRQRFNFKSWSVLAAGNMTKILCHNVSNFIS